MPIEVQDLEYDSPEQQFVYNKHGQNIVSLVCPEYVIDVPNDDCLSSIKLHLSDDTSSDQRNQWIFDSKNMIQSIKCADMLITTRSASGGGSQAIIVPSNQLVSVTDSNNQGTLLSVQGEVSLQGAT